MSNESAIQFLNEILPGFGDLHRERMRLEAIKNNRALPLELTGHEAEYRAFYEQITLEPDNWDQRGIFADWLEDIGAVVLCEGQRWQVRERKRAYPGPFQYEWWTSESSHASDLPEDIHGQLRIFENEASLSDFTRCRSYSNLHIAEIDLAMALSTQEQ